MPDDDWDEYMTQTAADEERKLAVLFWAVWLILTGAIWYVVWKAAMWLMKTHPALSMGLGLGLMAFAVFGLIYLCLHRWEGK